ncbi:MAG: hypothetical protein VX589_06575 [Myxococcota bacterium]|nr:hypothetical protein [Myxococcota bacterium]
MTRQSRLWIPWAIMACLLVPAWSNAQTDASNHALICHDEPVKLDRYRYLRALALDLTGTLPRPMDVDALADFDDDEPLPEALLDDMMSSDAFTAQVVRRHRSYFWPNLRNIDLLRTEQVMNRSRGIWWNGNRSRIYRTAGPDRVRCADEPAQFDADGQIVYALDENGFKIEGWVMVEPYWAPGEAMRVCAFDAQSKRYASDGTDCMGANGHRHVECGCGPNLNWCASSDVRRQIRQSFTTALEKQIARVIDERSTYLEIFTAQTDFIDGPITHFYRYLAPNADSPFEPLPIGLNRLPDLHYLDREWRRYERSMEHAGVLTHPAYLLRFQTDRARATRFYEAFLCSPFMPPEGGLPPASEESARNPDLQDRAGCKYCHSRLEPAAAHWGRWQENGAGFLPPSHFPAESEECLACALGDGRCNNRCRTFYLTSATSVQEEPYLGKLKAYTFRRDRHWNHIEYGPKYLARKAAVENELPVCVARKTAEWLLGRAIEGSQDERWLSDLAMIFTQSQFDYRALVKAIVQSAQYRRVQ